MSIHTNTFHNTHNKTQYLPILTCNFTDVIDRYSKTCKAGNQAYPNEEFKDLMANRMLAWIARCPEMKEQLRQMLLHKPVLGVGSHKSHSSHQLLQRLNRESMESLPPSIVAALISFLYSSLAANRASWLAVKFSYEFWHYSVMILWFFSYDFKTFWYDFIWISMWYHSLNWWNSFPKQWYHNNYITITHNEII